MLTGAGVYAFRRLKSKSLNNLTSARAGACRHGFRFRGDAGSAPGRIFRLRRVEDFDKQEQVMKRKNPSQLATRLASLALVASVLMSGVAGRAGAQSARRADAPLKPLDCGRRGHGRTDEGLLHLAPRGLSTRRGAALSTTPPDAPPPAPVLLVSLRHHRTLVREG